MLIICIWESFLSDIQPVLFNNFKSHPKPKMKFALIAAAAVAVSATSLQADRDLGEKANGAEAAFNEVIAVAKAATESESAYTAALDNAMMEE